MKTIIVTKWLKYAIYNHPTYYYEARTAYSFGSYAVGDTIEKAIANLRMKSSEAKIARYMQYGKELIPINSIG